MPTPDWRCLYRPGPGPGGRFDLLRSNWLHLIELKQRTGPVKFDLFS
jgi:hypothetical protein